MATYTGLKSLETYQPLLNLIEVADVPWYALPTDAAPTYQVPFEN